MRLAEPFSTGVKLTRDKLQDLPYIHAMNLATATYFFWFFGYPKPLAAAADRLT